MNDFTVYQLIDPRDGWPFYVGCTKSVDRRKTAHRYGREGTAIYQRIREIRADGFSPVFEVVKTDLNKIQALWLEREMIYEVPGLLNRPAGRLSEVLFPRKLGSPEAALESLSRDNDNEYARDYLSIWYTPPIPKPN